MSKVTFAKLGLKAKKEVTEVKVNDAINLEVRNYLPIDEKAALIQFVINHSLDDMTGCFSPVRVEVWFSIGVCKWYANISFTEKQLTEVGKTYDLLEENNIIKMIFSGIPEGEITFMQELVTETIDDVARYNTSAAGIIRSMTSDAGNLNTELNGILEQIKNAEGLENLSAIKDMVGTD